MIVKSMIVISIHFVNSEIHFVYTDNASFTAKWIRLIL